jgi:hypothetical protein
MIHGLADTYIKAEMTNRLFAFARQPKELWLVENAKHNQALQVAGEDYRRRVLCFFETHLAEVLEGEGQAAMPADSTNGQPQEEPPARRRITSSLLAPVFQAILLLLSRVAMLPGFVVGLFSCE